VRNVSFDVENLFERARALNAQTWEQCKPVLEKHARLNGLLNKPLFTADPGGASALLLRLCSGSD
jgi:hypothetical protein